jgi:monothiol glutaredoxin
MLVTIHPHAQAIEADPLVIFMKGTPQVPQCGFSRAVIQIMEVQV